MSGNECNASADPPVSDASTASVMSQSPDQFGLKEMGASLPTRSQSSTGGFINGAGSAWDVIAGKGMLLSDLREFLEDMAEQPQLRSCATLRALDRIRDALEKVPETSDRDMPIQITLQDAALLATQVLQRLR